MFNDVDKKLSLTFIVNLVVGLLYAWFSAKFIRFVLEFNEKSEPEVELKPTTINTIFTVFAVVCVVISIMSLWVWLALKFDKRAPFKWLKGAGKGLRIFGWIALVGGWAGGFCYCFWCFFHTVSDNFVINAISYTFISLVPVTVLIYCFAMFWYGLGNAADGGDATYVKDSKLFGMETLHGEDDTRKRCPYCGTRTDRHSCPNCGARVD